MLRKQILRESSTKRDLTFLELKKLLGIPPQRRSGLFQLYQSFSDPPYQPVADRFHTYDGQPITVVIIDHGYVTYYTGFTPPRPLVRFQPGTYQVDIG